VLEVVSGALNRWTNHIVPQWNPYIPKGGARPRAGLQGSAPSMQLSTASAQATQSGIPRQVVFLPTCVNRMMGASRGDSEYKGSTLEVFTRLAEKAGYQVIVPKVLVMLGFALAWSGC
jgi:D-lactate dehydrogenase